MDQLRKKKITSSKTFHHERKKKPVSPTSPNEKKKTQKKEASARRFPQGTIARAGPCYFQGHVKRQRVSIFWCSPGCQGARVIYKKDLKSYEILISKGVHFKIVGRNTVNNGLYLQLRYLWFCLVVSFEKWPGNPPAKWSFELSHLKNLYTSWERHQCLLEWFFNEITNNQNIGISSSKHWWCYYNMSGRLNDVKIIYYRCSH